MCSGMQLVSEIEEVAKRDCPSICTLFNFAFLAFGLFALRHKPRQERGNEDENEQFGHKVSSLIPCRRYF